LPRPPNCSGGSGSGPVLTGTLTITSIDATSVVVSLDVPPAVGWEVQNGDYTAALCP
jgi:hypothetical protein